MSQDTTQIDSTNSADDGQETPDAWSRTLRRTRNSHREMNWWLELISSYQPLVRPVVADPA